MLWGSLSLQCSVHCVASVFARASVPKGIALLPVTALSSSSWTATFWMWLKSVLDPLIAIPFQFFLKHTLRKSPYASFSLKVEMGAQGGLSHSNTAQKTLTNWASLKSLMPIRSSLYPLSLCHNRINLHAAGPWWMQGHVILRKGLSEFLLWQKGHSAVFQMLFLWNLSSEKSPMAGNIRNGAPGGFYRILQLLSVNLTKMLPGSIQTRLPGPNCFQGSCALFAWLKMRQIACSEVLQKV